MAYPELLLPVSPEVDSRLRTAVKDADLVRLLKDGTFNASLPGDDQFLVELHTARIVLEQVRRHNSRMPRRVPHYLMAADRFHLRMHT